MSRCAVIAALLVFLLPTPGVASTCALDVATLITDSGEVSYRVEIADEPGERRRGLMYRTDLARDAGMLFIFESPGPRAFWMRNTPLPLDILFIDETGRVLNIAETTTPYSEARIPSEGDALVVLEVNAGEAERHGFGPGTQVRHPAFTDAPEAHRCVD